MVAQWRFPNFSAKTLSVIAWAVASLGHTPTQEWLVSFEQQVGHMQRPPWTPCCSSTMPNAVAWCLCPPCHSCHVCLQVREKFHAFSGQELACIAWALRQFGYAPEHNAVFYMLERQVCTVVHKLLCHC
jgi:hypothetical protein